MKQLSKYVAVMALGTAASAALPSQLWAQDRDRDRDRDDRSSRDDRDRDRDDRSGREDRNSRNGNDRGSGQRLTENVVTAVDLPDEARRTIEREARGIDHFIDRQTRDGRTEYVVHYTRPGNERMVLRVDDRGELVGKPKLARVQHGRKTTEESVREEAADKGVRFQSVTERELPDAVRRTARKFTENGKDLFYREQIRDGKRFYAARFTTQEGERMWVRIAENGEVAAGPEISIGQDVGLNVATARGDDRDRRDRDRDRDRDRRDRDPDMDHDRDDTAGRDRVGDQPRAEELRRVEVTADDVPATVRRAIEQQTAGATDHRFIREVNREGQITYFVEYNRNGQRGAMRFDDRGGVLRSDDALAGTPPRTTTTELKREEIAVDKVPAEVRRTVEQETVGGTQHRVIRETHPDGQTTYWVEYVKNGQQGSLRVDARGKVVAETEVAGTPQPQPQPPQPATTEGAELGAAGGAAGIELLSVAKLPAEVRQAFEQATPGGSQHVVQRFTQEGRTLYTAHYATAEGDYNFVVVDDRGQVVVQPRPSRWLEGRKGVKFEHLSVGQVPAEVRDTVEQAAPKATGHVVFRRVRPDAEPTYLVQFTNAKGRRMQMEVNANGKVRNEPSAATDDPFRMADRREDRQEDREERRSERRSERQ